MSNQSVVFELGKIVATRGVASLVKGNFTDLAFA